MGLQARRLRWLALLVVIAAPAAARSSPLRPATLPGQIVFTSDDGADGSRELRVVDTAGRHRTRLTKHSPQGAFAAWSPRGRRIAFTSSEHVDDEYVARGLWTTNAAGTATRPVFERAADYIDGVWSPDGRRLAVIVDGELWVVRSDGSHRQRLNPKGIVADSDVAWSPDGRRLAVTECRGGRIGCGISVVDATGGSWRRITRRPTSQELEDDTDEVFEPAWSPDGRQVAFFRGLFDVGTTVPILVANADGSGERRVAYGDEPTWSPDGTKLAYVAAYGFSGSHGIGVVRADGTGHRSLGNAPGYEYAPAWSRDGSTVVFATTTKSKLRFFASSVVDRKPHRLVPAEARRLRGVIGDDRWSPSGRSFLTTRRAGDLLWVEAVTLSGHRRPLLAPARDSEPKWSPDGTRVAFARRDRHGVNVFVLGADGKAVRLAENGSDPTWSPTGKRLSFERHGAIYLVDDGGGAASELTAGADAAWSPDGQTILFERDRAVWSIRTDGSSAVKLSGALPSDPQCDELPHADRPAWSPDGSKVVYLVTNSPSCYAASLHISNPDGSSPVVVELGDAYGSERDRPSWSPDGTRILVVGDAGRIFVVEADGSGRKFVATGDTPGWSPDGRRIVFSRQPRKPGLSRADIWVVNADGSGKVRLVTGGLNLEPTWRPTAR